MLDLVLSLVLAPPFLDDDPAAAPERTPLESVRADAENLLPAVESELAQRFLLATADLPAIEGARVVHWNREAGRALAPAAFAKLDEGDREGFAEVALGEQYYYHTRYGTPVAYARVLDLLAANGLETVSGKRLLDFGYGNLGHLRLLASLGAHAVGVDVDELLEAFYREPGDTGAIERSEHARPGPAGSLRIVTGRFPATDEVVEAVGGPYDLVLSKNVLKSGYIHPEREADPRTVIDLGVDDATFLAAMHETLAPGGLFAIYNLYPKQLPPEEGYRTWATGDCPWPREALEAAGFEVLALNVVDDRPAREMAYRLRWHEPPQAMDVEGDLFATYTVLRRPAN